MKLAALNIRGSLLRKLPELLTIAETERIDILILSDIRITEQDITFIRSSQYYLDAHALEDTRTAAGVAIFTSKNIHQLVTSSSNNIVRGRLCKITFNSINVYGTYVPSAQKGKHVFDAIPKLPKTIIAGDFNRTTGNHSFTSMTSASWIYELDLFITQKDYVDVLTLTSTKNLHEHYTFFSSNSRSIIDHILISKDLMNQTINFETKLWPIIFSLDHRTVTASFDFSIQEPKTIPPPIRPKTKNRTTAEWKEWTKNFETKLENSELAKTLLDFDDLDTGYDILMDLATLWKDSATELFGTTEQKQPPKNPELYSRGKTIRKIVKAINTIRFPHPDEKINIRRIKKIEHLTTPIISNLTTLKWNLIKEYRAKQEEIRKEGIDHFKTNLTTLFSTNAGAFHSIINNFNKKQFQISIIRTTEGLITDPNKVKELVADFWSRISCDPYPTYFDVDDEPDFSCPWHNKKFYDKHYKDPKWNSLTTPIQEEELTDTIMKLGNGKATGPDGIINEYVKYSIKIDLIARFWQKMINLSLSNLDLPKKSKLGTIFPIPKNQETQNLNNLRPISLLSFTWRLMMLILNNRLSSILNNFNFFSDLQAGFRPNRSCQGMHSILRNIIDDSEKRSKPLYTMFTDIAKAFDTLPFNAIWLQLRRIGCPKNFITLLQNIYTDATASIVTAYGETDPVRLERGVRQGCPLSPLLFITTFQQAIDFTSDSDLGYELKSNYGDHSLTISNLAFADDVTLIAEKPKGIQKLLDKFSQVLGNIGLDLNPTKTKLIAFNTDKRPKILFHGNTTTTEINYLNKAEAFKFLGWNLTETQALSFNAHELYLETKIQPLLHNIFERYPIAARMKIHLFNLTIPSIISYGAASSILSNAFLTKMDAQICKRIRKLLPGLKSDTIHTDQSKGGAGVTSIKNHYYTTVIADSLSFFNSSNKTVAKSARIALENASFIPARSQLIEFSSKLSHILAPDSNPKALEIPNWFRNLRNALKFSKCSISYFSEKLNFFNPNQIIIAPLPKNVSDPSYIKKEFFLDQTNQICHVSLEDFRRFNASDIATVNQLITPNNQFVEFKPTFKSKRHTEDFYTEFKNRLTPFLPWVISTISKQVSSSRRISDNLIGNYTTSWNPSSKDRNFEKPHPLPMTPALLPKNFMEIIETLDLPITACSDGSAKVTKQTISGGYALYFGKNSPLNVAVATDTYIDTNEISAIELFVQMLPWKLKGIFDAKLILKTNEENYSYTLNPEKDVKAIIYSDSKSSIQAIKAWTETKKDSKRNNFPNRSIIANITEMVKNFDYAISFIHVKGHSGIPGNEAADHLANLGRFSISQNLIAHNSAHAPATLIHGNQIKEGNVRKLLDNLLYPSPESNFHAASFDLFARESIIPDPIFKFTLRARNETLPTFNRQYMIWSPRFFDEKYTEIQASIPDQLCIRCGMVETNRHVLTCDATTQRRKDLLAPIIDSIQKRKLDPSDLLFPDPSDALLGYIPKSYGKQENRNFLKQLNLDLISAGHTLWKERCAFLAEHPINSNSWYHLAELRRTEVSLQKPPDDDEEEEQENDQNQQTTSTTPNFDELDLIE